MSPLCNEMLTFFENAHHAQRLTGAKPSESIGPFPDQPDLNTVEIIRETIHFKCFN